MNLFDDENKIIEHFQKIKDEEVYFPYLNDEVDLLYRSIHEKAEWCNWIFSARKNDPPPDYYNEKMSVMMDVMRIDDHAFINEKGKVINPTNAAESVLRKELENSGILERFPNCREVFINATTTLPADKDHNYGLYKDNFVRVINEHDRKVELYKQNHPGYKTAFFVMDESSAYFQMWDKTERPEEGKLIKGKPHLFFFDKAFVDAIRTPRIDYLIWYAPFKLLRTDNGIFQLPKAIIYDVHKMDLDEIMYDQTGISSSEV